jgi:hypothetical protein
MISPVRLGSLYVRFLRSLVAANYSAVGNLDDRKAFETRME